MWRIHEKGLGRSLSWQRGLAADLSPEQRGAAANRGHDLAHFVLGGGDGIDWHLKGVQAIVSLIVLVSTEAPYGVD